MALTTVVWALLLLAGALALAAIIFRYLSAPGDAAVADRLIAAKGARPVAGMEAADHAKLAARGAEVWAAVARAQRRGRSRDVGRPRPAVPRIGLRRTGTGER